MPDRSRDDLAERIDELEETLLALREELVPERGPAGLPRPPRPREFLRFTDEYAIPAAVAAMQANIRALELLQAGIRATDTERAVEETERAVRDRASGIGRTSLERLDRVLAEVESAVEGSGAPRDGDARDLLADARRLDAEIRDLIGASGRSRPDEGDAIRIEVEGEPGGEDADGAADVEAELAAVKEEVESGARDEENDE